MIINGSSQTYLAALTRSTPRPEQRTGQSDSASAGQPASAQGAGPSAPRTGAAPLSGLHVLSGIQTTLPNGLTLGMFRFDLGTSGLDTSSDGASGGAAPATPTLEDQREDKQMLKSFMQMAQAFNDTPDPSDIELEGTAAVDLDLKTDLKA